MTDMPNFRFTLYIAGDAANSVQAIGNLRALCRKRLAGHCDIEVVDVFEEPERALRDGIFLTPTLVKLSPGPLRRVVGTLAETQVLLHALGLETATA